MRWGIFAVVGLLAVCLLGVARAQTKPVNHTDNVTTVAPDTSTLRLMGEVLGPQVTLFNGHTKVWSSYYTLNGQGIESPDEELIFNFYLAGLWGIPSTKSGPLVDQFLDTLSASLKNRRDARILYKFAVPNAAARPVAGPGGPRSTASKGLEFYVVFYEIEPGQKYSYLYLMKIFAMQDSAVSVTYSKKFMGPVNALVTDMKNWLRQDSKSKEGASEAIAKIKVDPSWIDFLNGEWKKLKAAKLGSVSGTCRLFGGSLACQSRNGRLQIVH